MRLHDPYPQPSYVIPALPGPGLPFSPPASDPRARDLESCLRQGEQDIALGRVGDGIAALERALVFAGEADPGPRLADVHLALSQAHELQGDAIAALRHFRSYHAAREAERRAESDERMRGLLLRAEVESARRDDQLLQERMDALAAANEEKARMLEQLRTQAEELERLSMEDPLTGVSNRRHLESQLALEWDRARRFAHPLTIAIIDADHFKSVNDTFSHRVGDSVLRVIAGVLRDRTRRVDIVARLGGEEFVVVLVETPAAIGARVCDELRAAIAAQDWFALAPGLGVTVSIGVAGSDEATSQDGAMGLADARLYEAKRAGRNRVVSH